MLLVLAAPPGCSNELLEHSTCFRKRSRGDELDNSEAGSYSTVKYALKGKFSFQKWVLAIIQLSDAKLTNRSAEIAPLMSFKPYSSKRGSSWNDRFSFQKNIWLTFSRSYSEPHGLSCPRERDIYDTEERRYVPSGYIKKDIMPRTNRNGVRFE